jgi:hypothetical protein
MSFIARPIPARSAGKPTAQTIIIIIITTTTTTTTTGCCRLPS